MANVQSFPLFRLPLLAYENVIDLLHLKEKFNLAATSKKSSLRVKRYNHIKKHKLIIFLWRDENSAQLYVYVDRGDKPHIKDSNSWNYKLRNYHNLATDPTISQITQMAAVAPNASFRLKFCDPSPVLHTTFIPLAKHLNLSLKSVESFYMMLPPDDGLCRYVFENCKHAQSLIHHRKTTPGFRLDPDIMGSYSFDYLDITNASWLTGDHLKKCFNNCRLISMSDTSFSVEDMNDFLKLWIEGSEVQEMVLVENDPDCNVTDLLVGIPFVTQPHVHDKRFNCVVSPGYVIKSNQGIKAFIHLAEDMFHLTTEFEIVDGTFSPEESDDEEYEEDYDGED